VGEIVIGKDNRRAIRTRVANNGIRKGASRLRFRGYAFLMMILIKRKEKKEKKRKGKGKKDSPAEQFACRQQRSPRPSRPFVIANVSADAVNAQ
jgi:hypothetical protein